MQRKTLALLPVAGVGAALYRRDRLSVDMLTVRLREIGWIAPVAFIGCSAFATVFLHGLPFTLAGGSEDGVRKALPALALLASIAFALHLFVRRRKRIP